MIQQQPVVVYPMPKGHIFVAFDDQSNVIGVGNSLNDSLNYKPHASIAYDIPSYLLQLGTVVKNMDNCLRVTGITNFVKTRIPSNILNCTDFFLLVDKDNTNKACLFALDKEYPNLNPIVIQCDAGTLLSSLEYGIKEFLLQWHKKTNVSKDVNKTTKLTSWWVRYFNRLDTVAFDKIMC